MWSPLLLQCTWWLVSKTKKAMVEYELNLQGWLDEATLFPAEPSDYGFNFDELLNGGKTNYEAELVTGLPDLDWLDAQADLSILDYPKDLNLQPFDIADPLNLDDAANLLLGLIDNSNLDDSYLSSDVSKNELNDILNASTQIEQQMASPEIPDVPMSSPYYESISEEASSPASTSCSSERLNSDVCLSPGGISSIDDGGYESISEAFTPGAASTSSVLDSGAITVTVCDMDTDNSNLQLDKTVSIDEITRSVRKRRYVSDGKDIPKVHVTLKNVFHPYAKAAPKRSGGKKERKKIQNKEAAARYRIKKKIEEKVIGGEVECLEKEQEDLRKKHDELFNEIKYLKNLMREVLQKKGIL